MLGLSLSVLKSDIAGFGAMTRYDFVSIEQGGSPPPWRLFYKSLRNQASSATKDNTFCNGLDACRRLTELAEHCLGQRKQTAC